MAKNLIIGTAGHIDHGKTTLIKALTGVDTDRLIEEKERGITIDLGFSYLELDDDLQVGIIDVPGHEKFIKNMLAGAGGVDLGLLVIAADESVMAQTKEHLAVLELLNLKRGVIVVTKIDLVEEEWLDLVISEVREVVKGTFLEEATIIPVSAISKRGIREVEIELKSLVESMPDKEDDGNIYLPIDRVFTLKGHGTIITGTLISGRIEVEDILKIYPKGIKVRVRSLQVHNQSVNRVLPGQRVGINLAGVDIDEIQRGDVLATLGSLSRTNYLDARLELLKETSLLLENGDRIRLHLGAKEVIGRVYLLDQEDLYLGEEGLVQFRLEDEVVAKFKESYVIRSYSPMMTIGGGEILAIKPKRHRRFDDKEIKYLNLKNQGSYREWISLEIKRHKDPLILDDLVRKTGLSNKQLEVELEELEDTGQIISIESGRERRVIHYDNYQRLKEDIIQKLEEYHLKYHLRAGMPKEELRSKLFMNLNLNGYDFLLRELKEEGRIRVQGVFVAKSEFEINFSLKEERIKDRIISLFSKKGFMPPNLDEVVGKFEDKEIVEEVFKRLLYDNKLIKINNDIYILYQFLEEAESLLKDYLLKEGEIELGEFRDLLKSSRKYTLSLLDYFDQKGITIRVGNKRRLKRE